MAMGSMIDRAWRLCGTGILFAVFGIGGLTLAVFVIPLVSVFSRDEETRTRRVRSLICRSFRGFLWLMHALGVADFIVDPEGKEKLLRSGGMIVVANHPTLIDVVQLLAQIEQGNCIVKRAIWNNLFLGGVVRAANYISNRDSEELLSKCAAVLRRGETLVIFPEATRTTPGRAMKLRRGAARIALMAGVPVQLVHLRCNPSTLSKAEHWYEIPPQRPCFKMTVGDTLDVGRFLVEGEHRSLASRRLTRVLCRTLMSNESD